MSQDQPQQAGLGSPAVRTIGTGMGVLAFCIYSRSWQDGWHVVYDLTAGLAVYSFLAQVLAEGLAGQFTRHWWVRLAAIAAMTVVTLGRELAGWPVSGHVTTVMATAIIQSADARLSLGRRALYWAPVPILVVIRVVALDRGLGQPLGLGLLAGAIVGILAVLLSRKSGDASRAIP